MNLNSKQNLSYKTKQLYYYWFNRFLKFYDFKKSLAKNIETYQHFCVQNYHLETQKIIISALKYYFQNATEAKILKIPSTNYIIKGSIISEAEYRKVIENYIASDYYVSVRNRELFKVLWKTGLRIGEALNLKWTNIKDSYIIVQGKNNFQRTIYYQNNLFQELFKLKQSNYIFTTKKGKKLSYSAISSFFQDVKLILKRSDVSPHSLRHSFATRLLANNIPISYLSKLMGHKSIETTTLYIHYQDHDIIALLKKVL